jgi:hypothetical protein
LIGLASVVLAGCGVDQRKSAAEDLMARYYQSITPLDLEAVLSLYDPTFFEATSRDDWSEELTTFTDRMGRYVSRRLVAWKVSTSGEDGPSVRLRYEVEYQGGAAAETFLIVGSDALRIAGQNIQKLEISADDI